MALSDAIKKKENADITEERIRAIIPVARQYISFWRDYPDIFIDFMSGKLLLEKREDASEEEKSQVFSLFFYQRVFLRAAMRHKYVYATFPRAYSKSFLSTMVLMIRCVLYPAAKLFVTAGGKEQSAGIIQEKVEEICELIPAFRKEIVFESRVGLKKCTFTKDYVKIVFKNRSWFDNIPGSEKARGKRRHGGLIEEAVGVDGKILSEVIIPIMNISRRNLDGTVSPHDSLNKSQIYVTTSGFKNTFPCVKHLS